MTVCFDPDCWRIFMYIAANKKNKKKKGGSNIKSIVLGFVKLIRHKSEVNLL
jgi:hypothetical protein